MPQRPHFFYGSVLENIRLARPSASREEVERAAELAGAAKFIRRLPHGYDTEIGERGARLSKGRGQRVAIARGAFLGRAGARHGTSQLRASTRRASAGSGPRSNAWPGAVPCS